MALIAAAHAAEIEVLDSRTTEAINGRLEALRRNALGFRNPTNYRLRSLLPDFYHCWGSADSVAR
jgi:Transposase